MSGTGNTLNTSQRNIPSGFPFIAGSARNGLSIDATGRAVLGQDIGAVGDPAQLLSNREIPMSGFTFAMRQGANDFFFLNGAGQIWFIGNFAGATSVLVCNPGLTAQELAFFDSAGIPRFNVATPAAGISALNADDFVTVLQIQNAANGGQAILGGTTSMTANCNTNTFNIVAANGLFITGDTFVAHYAAALSNNAGVAAGTLLNAPAAGNPTKWLAIDDNGVTRRFPTW